MICENCNLKFTIRDLYIDDKKDQQSPSTSITDDKLIATASPSLSSSSSVALVAKNYDEDYVKKYRASLKILTKIFSQQYYNEDCSDDDIEDKINYKKTMTLKATSDIHEFLNDNFSVKHLFKFHNFWHKFDSCQQVHVDEKKLEIFPNTINDIRKSIYAKIENLKHKSSNQNTYQYYLYLDIHTNIMENLVESFVSELDKLTRLFDYGKFVFTEDD